MPKRSASDWILEAVALTTVTAIVIFLAAHWAELPAQVPKHFGISGKPDGWGSRNSLLLMPIAAIAVYIIVTLAARHQKLINVPISIDRDSPEVQRLLQSLAILLKTFALLAFIYMEWASINTALGRADGLGKAFFPVFTLLIFVPLGVYLQKLRKYSNQSPQASRSTR